MSIPIDVQIRALIAVELDIPAERVRCSVVQDHLEIEFDPPLLKEEGWRYDAFGKLLTDLVNRLCQNDEDADDRSD